MRSDRSVVVLPCFVLECWTGWKTKSMSTTIFVTLQGPLRWTFHSDLPPPRAIWNHSSCEPFAELISQSIKQRLATGVISVWGRVGECKPLHKVLPLRVEPTKPRFCNDNKFLNLWVQDRPFSLDYLYPLPFYDEKDTYQTVCDVKLGYNSNNNNSLILVVRKYHLHMIKCA